MHNFDDSKTAAWTPQSGNLAGCTNQCAEPSRPPTMREQAEKNTAHHYEQADKHARAAQFFRDNPAFDEFIRLVRSGTIQF